MAEKQSIKRFIVRDPHGHIEQEDSFSVVGEVHVDIVPGYGEPYADSEYIDGILTITIHNIEGNGITDITIDSQEGDEAVNTVTIKSNDNPEGVTLQVRNGSRGNGIASISEVLSPDDGGVNTHTITDTDGNEHVFHTKNGSKGDKGDQGDSAIWTGEGEPWSGLKNTTGQSTTEPMTQKAVTKAAYTYEAVKTAYIESVKMNPSSSKTWSDSYNGKFIPVAPGERYALIGNPIAVVLLRSFTYAKNASFESNLAQGQTDRIVETGGYLDITMPSDCTIMYVQEANSNGNILPDIYKLVDKPTADETGKAIRKVPLGDATVVSGKYIQSGPNFTWGNQTGGVSVVFSVNEGDKILIEPNKNNTVAQVALMTTLGTPQAAQRANVACPRLTIPAGTSDTIKLTIPPGVHALYCYSNIPTATIRPYVYKYEETDGNAIHMSLSGNGATTAERYFKLEDNHIYHIHLKDNTWKMPSLASDYLAFCLIVDGQYLAKYNIGDVIKQQDYYVLSKGDELRVIVRADVGVDVGVDIYDVTDNFTRKKYDIAFVSSEEKEESMMVKLSQGDLARYSVTASSGNAYLKAYSRAIRNDDYLVESLTADSSGVFSGEYMPREDVYVVVESNAGTNLVFAVYNHGNSDDNGLIYPLPNQLIFRPEDTITMLTSQDEDVTIYDDYLLNYAQVIEHGGLYYCLYQSFANKDNHSKMYICMAYSSDGVNWTRGIPDGVTPPNPGTNVVIMPGPITGTFQTEMIDGLCVCKVLDAEYPFRMISEIRNGTNTSVGARVWMLKSKDLANWVPVKKITDGHHDTAPSAISCGNYIQIWLRMWDYTEPLAKQRMIGSMYVDLDGNVITPPSGVWGQSLYNPAATKIGEGRTLFIPTMFHVASGYVGTDEFETYIEENGKVYYAPSYNIDAIKGTSTGWGWGAGLVAIGRKQYFVYSVRDQDSHDASGVITGNTMLRLCPIEWITYASRNTSGD